MTSQIAIEVTARNQAAAGLRAAAADVSRLDAATGRVAANTKKSGGLLGKLGGIGAGVAKVLGPVGLALSAAEAGKAVIKLGTDSVRAGSDLQQSLGAAEAVFGKNAKAIKASADAAAQSVGLSRAEYLQLAAVLGAGLKNQGIKDYGDQTQRVLKLGADLAAQFGGSTKDAVEAIGSLMRGETDPIERYGVSINQAAINAYLLEHGQSKLTGAALKAAQAQARLALLTKQTSQAQGTFARESNTLAGQQQRLAATVENLKARLGTALLPAITAVVGFFNQAASGSGRVGAAFQVLGQMIQQRIAPVLAGLKAAWASISSAFLDAVGGSGNLQKAIVVLVPILQKAGVITGQIVGGAFRVLGVIIGVTIKVIAALVKGIISVVKWAIELGKRIAATPTGRAIFQTIVNLVRMVVNNVRIMISVVQLVAAAIGRVRAGIFSTLAPIIARVVTAARPVIDVMGRVNAAIGRVRSGALGAIASAIGSIASAAWGAVSAVTALINRLQSSVLGTLASKVAGLMRDGSGGLIVPDVGRRITPIVNVAPPTVILDGAALRAIVRSEVRAALPSGRTLP